MKRRGCPAFYPASRITIVRRQTRLLPNSTWGVMRDMISVGCLPPEGRKQPMMGKRKFAPKLYYQLSLAQQFKKEGL